jgi:hypothetical protein
MSEMTIDRQLSPEDFTRGEDVALLSREAFTLNEMVEAIPFTRALINGAITRDKIQLLSTPIRGRFHRKFHILDVYAISLFLVFAKTVTANTDYQTESRKALVREVHKLLWGEPVSPEERLAREAEFAAKAEAAKRGSAADKRKFDEFVFKLNGARRCELLADVFNAPPHVWNRDPDRNFAVFLRRDVTLYLALFERGVENPMTTDALLANGFTGHLNLTKTLATIDAKLSEIVERRNRPLEVVD